MEQFCRLVDVGLFCRFRYKIKTHLKIIYNTPYGIGLSKNNFQILFLIILYGICITNADSNYIEHFVLFFESLSYKYNIYIFIEVGAIGILAH